jgi:hypothetical protein
MKKNKLKFTLLLAIIAFSFQLTAQITYTFTNAGATGRYGPTQAQLNSAYLSTNLNGLVISNSGIQTWTVPVTGIYRIQAGGASGGNFSNYPFGTGSSLRGDFSLVAGEVIKIVVGQRGIDVPSSAIWEGGGGGGGSYVVKSIGNVPLIVAAGGSGGDGGGSGNAYATRPKPGGSSATGNPNTVGTTVASLASSAGGGFIYNGQNGYASTGGFSFLNGSNGGTCSYLSGINHGGFGGGGAGDWYTTGGAGGGYQGGSVLAGGYGTTNGITQAFSYNNGTNQINSNGITTTNTAIKLNGLITITNLFGVNISQTSSISCNGFSTAALSSTVNGGLAPYTYTWTPGGANTTSISGLGAGVYTVTVKDANNAFTTGIYTVTQPAVLAATATQTNLTCFGSGNGRASVAVTGGTAPYTYSWTPTGGSTANAINLAANNYTCTVTDANACPVLATTFNITQPVSLISATSTQTNVSCFGGSNGVGAITATGGTGALTYSWTPSGGTSATASGLAANNYSCTIKDVNNCSITNTLTITQPTALTSTLSSQTNVSCNAGSNGAASVSATGGTTAYTYAWTPTGGSSASATGLAAGTYTCTITDAKSCVSTKTVAITQPAAALAAATTQTNILCFGLNTGAANVATTGGTTAYTYVWAPTGGTAATASSLVAGNYTCTITDANACTLVKTFALTEGSAFSITGSATNTVLCNGVSTTLNGAGATTYTWTGGVTNGTSFIPTTTTSYSLTGRNASNCPASNTVVVTVTVNPLPLVTVNSGSICNGSSFTMNPSGASTYVYSGGSSTVNPTTNTNYTVTGTSALGCTNTVVSNVTVNANPVLTVNSGSICSGNNFTFTPTGSTTYSYSSGSAIASPSVTTDYTISTTNAFGCTTNSVKTITVSITPVINVSSGAVCTGGTWTITPTGAATYTYSSGSAVVTPTAAITNYTVSGSNIDGCQSLAVITITVNPTLLFNPNSGSVCIGSSYTITPTGASSYTFSSGSAVVTPTANTTYTIVAENSVGCLGTDICTIVVNSLPTVTAASNFTLICVGEIATLTAGGASTYVWSTSATTASTPVTPTTTTVYNVNGTDVNGCVNTANVTVNVNDCVGIQQLSSAKLNVSVYPNPTTGLITLDLNATTQVTITNALGQVVYSETVVAGKQTIDLKNQHNGLYFMNLNQDGKQQTIKVIKN